jgi:hypothetical protein
MLVPSARRPSAMSSVSRLTSGRRITVGRFASAPSTRARFVIDLEPGTVTVAFTGAAARGARQGAASTAVERRRATQAASGSCSRTASTFAAVTFRARCALFFAVRRARFDACSAR